MWVGDKDTGKIFEISPSKIFREHDLYVDYELENFDIKDDKNERILAKIESSAAPVIRKIIERGNRREPPSLSSNERDVWKHFYASMCRRTPEFLVEHFMNDEQYDNAWTSAIKQLCASTGSAEFQSVISNKSHKMMKIKDAMKQNTKARFASGDHRILQEDVESLCRDTGMLIAVICHHKRSFVIGSRGITTVHSGKAGGSWLPVSPDVAVVPTPYPDREILWPLDQSREHIVKRINVSTVQQSRFIAGRSKTLIQSLIEG